MSHALILGLSGPSSSGKTTLARLLRSIFPHTLVLHEDDFYRPEAELPFRAGFRDWDCAAALDTPALVRALAAVRRDGRLPAGLVSKEDRNAAGAHGVPRERVAALQGAVDAWMRAAGGGGPVLSEARKMVVLEGFLLFGEGVREVREAVDVRMLLRVTCARAKERRERRGGYVTLEGFWADPPGYVEKVVWPGYVEEHGFMFEGGDVDGTVDEKVVQDLQIRVCPGGGEWPMEKVLEWAVDNVMEALSATAKGSDQLPEQHTGDKAKQNC
ncbi:ribosylnicotinamide kinase [Xylographa trunciseda]|nr:ribosylnicotinamide kinase [Xylographa trunciseda]